MVPNKQDRDGDYRRPFKHVIALLFKNKEEISEFLLFQQLIFFKICLGVHSSKTLVYFTQTLNGRYISIGYKMLTLQNQDYLKTNKFKDHIKSKYFIFAQGNFHPTC